MPVYTEDELGWDDNENVFCPFCEQRGYKNALGGKILMPGVVRPDDYENFLQCPVCYEVIPLHETYQDATIKDVIEKSDNAFEQGKFVSESIPNRNSPAGKKALEKRKRERNRAHHKDPEIDALLRIYGEDNVSIIEDTDPQYTKLIHLPL